MDLLSLLYVVCVFFIIFVNINGTCITNKKKDMRYTNTLLLRFSNPLSAKEIVSFRGAVNRSISSKDILFHNHTVGGGYRYSYPLIQYKRVNGKAAILCLDAGAQAIGQLISDSDFLFSINGKKRQFNVECVLSYRDVIQVCDTKFMYSIKGWLPFNEDNYSRYQGLTDLVGKLFFLENILKGNILSIGKGIGVFFDSPIECNITQISDSKITQYKGVTRTMFDVTFLSNVHIPNYFGVGKGVSVGYGTIMKIDDN